MKSIKTYKKDWCIKLTVENIDKVKQYLLSTYYQEILSVNYRLWMNWTIGAYYGINDNGLMHGSINRFSINLITDEEFEQMINVNDDYEIY